MLQSLIRLRATLRSIADADDHCGPSVVPGVLQALRRHDGSAVPPGSSRVHRA